MKRAQIILLIAVLCGVAAYSAFVMFWTGTSSAGTSGLGFGNCLVQYQWTSRNEGPKKILNLVVCSEEPSEFGGRPGRKEVHARFSDGSNSTVVPDASSFAWLEPGKQPRRIEVRDLRTIVTQIEQNSSASISAKFTGPEEFLAGIQKLAEQAGRGDGDKHPN